MGYVSPVDLAKVAVVREGTKVASLLEFLKEHAVTDPQVIADTIEGETNFKERIEQLLRLEGEMLAQAAGLKSYIKDLAERVEKYERTAKDVRASIDEAFVRAQVPTIATMSGTVYTKANKLGAAVVNEEAVPSQFFAYKLDEAAAKKAAVVRANERRALAEAFIDGQEVEMVLALWQFDLDNPEITGVEVDAEVTYSVAIRRK